MRRRHPLVSLVIYIALMVALIFVVVSVVILITSKPAGSATACASRPGLSRGAVWWRWRYSESGARCWYPGAKRARYYVRSASLRKRMAPPREQTRGELARGTDSLPVPPAELRTVRVIQIYNGRTAHERIERAFDKLMIFPVEDEP